MPPLSAIYCSVTNYPQTWWLTAIKIYCLRGIQKWLAVWLWLGVSHEVAGKSLSSEHLARGSACRMALTWLWWPSGTLSSSSRGFFMGCLSIVTTQRLTTPQCKIQDGTMENPQRLLRPCLGNHTVVLAIFYGLHKLAFFFHDERELYKGMSPRRQRWLGTFLEACCCTRNSEHAVPFASAALTSFLPGPLLSIHLGPPQMALPLWSILWIH